MSNSTLSYYTPADQSFSNRAQPTVLATGAALCLGIPLLGLAIRNAPLFFFGGLIAPLIGFALGMMGLLGARGRGQSVVSFCALALAGNTFVGGFFVWLMFVHGIC